MTRQIVNQSNTRIKNVRSLEISSLNDSSISLTSDIIRIFKNTKNKRDKKMRI